MTELQEASYAFETAIMFPMFVLGLVFLGVLFFIFKEAIETYKSRRR